MAITGRYHVILIPISELLLKIVVITFGIIIVASTMDTDFTLTDNDVRRLGGRCPPAIDNMPVGNCSDKIYPNVSVTEQSASEWSYCTDDSDCDGLSSDNDVKQRLICCFDGCNHTCRQPVYTACEHQQMSTTLTTQVKRCLGDGRFDPIQCKHDMPGLLPADHLQHQQQLCWCVDESGLEIAGTRVNGTRDTVNCTSPRPCAGHLCRMLCPFEFELDDDGCPLCQCRDPCRGVKCPGGTRCHLEIVSCLQDPCPPIPTCKKPRSLDNVCSVGKALTVGDNDKLFLCGEGPTKPTCPSFFDCEIQTGHEYGVCCPSPDELLKPGSCPDMSRNNSSVIITGSFCQHDMECEGLQKCCECKECGGFICVPMAENTVCLQQRILAELLSVGELAGRGYVPQCSPNTGHFEHRQCSRNGRICWCVHPEDGAKISRTMGPADNVHCNPMAAPTSTINSISFDNMVSENQHHLCDTIICTGVCPYGFEIDENGCQTCDCADLCESVVCPIGTQCIIVEVDFCESKTCESVPVCRPPPIPYSKPGSCPLLSPEQLTENICDNTTCMDDSNCTDNLKCCPHTSCGWSCVQPRMVNHRLPTMCEYLRDFVSNAMDEVRATAVALPRPICKQDGSFERVQCDAMDCWCADEFGSELESTRTVASGRSKMDCNTAVRHKSCDGLLCRLGCDYGFDRDQDGCPICECRNPCQGVKCDEGFECQMIEVNCYGGFCPSVPQCVSTKPISSVAVCHEGEPLKNTAVNIIRSCGPSNLCPTSYFCHAVHQQQQFDEVQRQHGICCKKSVKSGQCPYRFLPRLGMCENASTCESDHQCPDSKKCCSDGCKSACVEPEMKTGCEHAALVAHFMLKERSFVLGEPFVPSCNDYDGSFALRQCRGQTCWCVNRITGQEISGTRSKSSATLIDCTNNSSSSALSIKTCPKLSSNCYLNCSDGFRLSDKGCPMCSCHDPCEDFLCSKRNEECVSVRLNCITEPCPSIPMCVLRHDNPCPHGDPIKDRVCSSLPGSITCPSTHICLKNPIFDFNSVCCPKSRDMCILDPEFKRCSTAEGNIARWIFSVTDNKCIEVPSGKCPSSTNNFLSKTDCETTCPSLSECERAREKAFNIATKDDKLRFTPKCRRTGEWEPVQCLPEIGLCWCVSGTSGEFMKGSAVRGTPRCGGARMGRRMDGDQDLINWMSSSSTSLEVANTSVCSREGKHVVHLCDASLCEGKVCLSRPNAICRVDPCDGCRYAMHDVNGDEVDCEDGFTECQRDVHGVINSNGWSQRVADFFGQILSPELDESASKLILGALLHDSGAVSANIYNIMRRHVHSQQRRSVGPSVLSKDAGDFTEIIDGVVGQFSKRPEEVEDELSRRQPYMVALPPLCKNDGSYESVQRQGSLAWCVNAHGKPIHASLTRISSTDQQLKCMADLSRVTSSDKPDEKSRELICPDSNKMPKVCTDECLRAECPSHPKALCLADPCNECRVSFVDKGVTVNCQDRCSQPLEIGMCRAAFPRWHFNQTSKLCESFMYGGCLGNDNNFDNRKLCVDECTKPVSICSLSKEVGMCRASMKRWWFNEKTHKCERFIFGGCDGNANNFESREQCEATCPDVVLCSRLPPTIDGLQACHRSVICSNVTCDSNPDAVCTVDPCDCRPFFVDYEGSQVDCVNKTKDAVPYSTSMDSAFTQLSTACQKRHSKHIVDDTQLPVLPECNFDGVFVPIHCDYSTVSSRNESTKCLCVDETRKLLVEVSSFLQGNHPDCRFDNFDSVSISLVFERKNKSMETFSEGIRDGVFKERIRREMAILLSGLRASINENDIIVKLLHSIVHVNFTLYGQNNIPLTYILQEKLEAGSIVIQVEGLNLFPANYRTSLFNSRLSLEEESSTLSANNDQIHLIADEGDVTATVVICAAVVGVLALLLLAIYVSIHKRHCRGYYPRGSMDSLSPVNNFVYGTATVSSHASWSSANGLGQPTITNIDGSTSSVSPFDHHYEVLEDTAATEYYPSDRKYHQSER